MLRLWREGYVTLCLSQAIVAKYAEVLARLGVDPDTVAELLGLLARGHRCLFAGRTL